MFGWVSPITRPAGRVVAVSELAVLAEAVGGVGDVACRDVRDRAVADPFATDR